MWFTWSIREMHLHGFCRESAKDNLEVLGIDGRIILKQILHKQGEMA
jgi:hypothetical protein